MHSRARYAIGMMGAAERLKAAREAAGFENATVAAEAMGVKPPTYLAHENGSRGFPASRAKKYADFFRTSADWLLYGGEAAPPPRGKRTQHRRTVPLVGYVGAGAEAHYYATGDSHLGEVDAPEDATPETVAVEIRGTSLGAIFESWLIYYDEVRSPVTDDLLGELCVVGLPDDRVLVKKLRPARTPGLYHLESNTEPTMLDEEILWAAKVKNMRPR